jgi:hypothetical protein
VQGLGKEKAQLRHTVEEYKGLALRAERLRERYQGELLKSKVKVDKQMNLIIKLTEEGRLKDLDHEIFGNQLGNLYKAIENLSGKKFVEDRHAFEMDEAKRSYEEVLMERNKEEICNKVLLNERDKLRQDLREMIKSRKLLIQDKEIYARATKDKISSLEVELMTKKKALDFKEDEFLKLDKAFKMLLNERDKLKDRLQRLKNKRLRVDVNQKL